MFWYMLAGAGIKTQSRFQATEELHGSTYFTLATPVSRRSEGRARQAGDGRGPRSDTLRPAPRGSCSGAASAPHGVRYVGIMGQSCLYASLRFTFQACSSRPF